MAAPRTVLRNPKVEQIMGAVFTEMAIGFKGEAARILSSHTPKLERPQAYAWRGNARPRQFASISAIPTRTVVPPPSTIAFIDKSKGALLAEVAAAAVSRWARLAPVRTGVYSGSLEIELNGKPTSLTTLFKYSVVNPFSDNEEVWIFPTAFYAAALEYNYYRRDKSGIVLRVVNELIAAFGSRASIQFAYIQGRSRYALPAIRIGAPGAFASGVKKSLPGRNARRRARKKRAR